MGRRLTRLVAAVLAAPALALALVVGGAGPAAACSCAEIDDATAFDQADAVFVGTLERFYEARAGSSANPAVSVLTVSAVYKGTVTERQAVVSPADGASCGITFTDGVEYLVFGSSSATLFDGELEDGFYAVGLCNGTRPLAQASPGFDAADQLPDLGGPGSTAIQDQLGSPRPSLFPEILIFVGVLALVLGIASWHSLKRRRAATG